MRIKEESKAEVKKTILTFLKQSNDYLNLSEIARKIGKAPPTVMKYIQELEHDGKVEVVDKKSMKLIRMR
jgi:Mn-dependent DtxR family transcriptional regulator